MSQFRFIILFESSSILYNCMILEIKVFLSKLLEKFERKT
ncbi:hypothetical protein LEP1GSC083_3125 [Leptospira interrogans serovar Pyrogenes str. L0374]|uniref:Uncharacterized protein n=4 Tax=Leptospira interrogans TaxID=173 RepID=M6ZQL3_LEPIR|nr:hypothetical protein LEP1GSC104_0534 [Leptospira interrogans str. UI 12621]EMF40914.1 hypothetical protein LEP1GSC067_2286 [Leptospira interrogans serovar Lora str. TE 1992]EMF74268.1 hypothetical protein LEP1GSC148_0346 [Leptospira interrogans serovar Canicola str. LT1962]EMN30641.1 hypothetical protein LEP1GSC083_3125 [Leptospira interrogans serovar Pyrogenes str. L0374]EMP06492.1 hypothetical protein LEP1GSC124_3267 [Leptospira interrogans serovar Pyrogenes str. 200701872]